MVYISGDLLPPLKERYEDSHTRAHFRASKLSLAFTYGQNSEVFNTSYNSLFMAKLLSVFVQQSLD